MIVKLCYMSSELHNSRKSCCMRGLVLFRTRADGVSDVSVTASSPRSIDASSVNVSHGGPLKIQSTVQMLLTFPAAETMADSASTHCASRSRLQDVVRNRPGNIHT